jgi:hypothetical protein
LPELNDNVFFFNFDLQVNVILLKMLLHQLGGGSVLKFYIKKCQNWAGGVAQVIQHLPSKCEALSTNPSTTKKKKREREFGSHR